MYEQERAWAERIETFFKSIGEARTILERASQAHSDLDQMEKQRDNTRVELDTWNRRLAAAEANYRNMEVEMASKRKQFDDEKNRLAQEYADKTNKLETEYNRKVGDLEARYQQRISALKGEVSDLEGQVAHLEARRHEAETALRGAIARVQSLAG